MLAGSDNHDLSILKEYADFWKVPYSLGSQFDEKHLMFTSSPSQKFDTRDPNPVIISPTRIEGATQIARQFGLKVTSDETLVRLPITPTASVSLKARLYRFSGTNVEGVLKDHDNTII